MKYTDGIEWNWDGFEGFDWVDAYTEEGNVRGTSREKGVFVEYTAIASRTGDHFEIDEDSVYVEGMTPITREEEL